MSTGEVSSNISQPAKKRARQSCDTCRNRKTKCVAQGVNSKCRHCEAVGAVCSSSNLPRKRPFYRVSEEEYESSMRLLRHFVPDTDLNLGSIKQLLAELEGHSTAPAGSNSTVRHTPTSETTKQSESRESPPGKSPECDDDSIVLEDTAPMIIDPSGKYRYVDADSSLRFEHEARVARQSRSSQNASSAEDKTVISPFITGMPQPSETGHDVITARDIAELHLPSRETCMKYATIFFEQVHCIYWVYSSEQFFSRLDKTFEDGLDSCNPSWLCSLYSILAIASILPAEISQASDAKSSSYYLSIARNLSVRACEMADTESLRAIVLLSIAFHSNMHSMSFYLSIGVAVRIALSLGLHRNVSPKSQDLVDRERCRRLWWCIYQLDQEVSVQLGHPCAIVDQALCIQTPFASEQLLDPGRNTPPEYQAVYISLIKLCKRISQTLYVVPAQTTRKVQLQVVNSAMGDLQLWREQLPPHLRCSTHIYPSHRRAVYTLHLRYWKAMIHVTRPFLVYTVARASELLRHEAKKQKYGELSNTCQDAAEHAVDILKMMAEHQLLSSLLPFDVNYILELLQVFLLIKYRDNPAACSEQMESCMEVCRSMPLVGWTKRTFPEIRALMNEANSLRSATRGSGNLETEPGRGFQPLLQNSLFVDTRLAAQPPLMGTDNVADIQFDSNSAQMDIFETLGLDMEVFSSMNWPEV